MMKDNYASYLHNEGLADEDEIAQALDSFATPELPDELDYHFNGRNALDKVRMNSGAESENSIAAYIQDNGARQR